MQRFRWQFSRSDLFLILFFVQAALHANACPATAQAKSLQTSGTNILSIRDCFVMPGQQVTVYIDVNNQDAFHSFQFDLVFPSALTVLSATFELTDRKQDQTLNWNMVAANTYRFIAISMTKSPFTGTSGAVLKLDCQATGSAGVYSILAQQVTLLDANWQNILTSVDNGSVTIYAEPARVRIKAWLEGWHNVGLMRTDLAVAGDLPMTSPYPQDPRMAISLPTTIADWILLELRTTPDGPAIQWQSFLLRNDGYLCEMDGSTTNLTLNAPAGTYWLVLHHRNHATVMSASAQVLNASSVAFYEFISGLGQYYGGSGKAIGGGYHAMPCGDINGDGLITSVDYVRWYHKSITLPGAGYYLEDLNGDRQVDLSDFNVWIANARDGYGSGVP